MSGEHEMPVTKGFRLSMAVPGGTYMEFAVPAASTVAPSRHTETAAVIEDVMLGTMQDMRIAHVDRNAELKEQLDAIDARRNHISARLAVEVSARDAQFAQLRSLMETSFSALETELSGLIRETFTTAETTLPPLSTQLDSTEEEERDFYTNTVPATNERMCGSHIREMNGHKEALALDATTTRAREARVTNRLDKHCEVYDVRCTVEAEDRQQQHESLLKQFTEQVRLPPVRGCVASSRMGIACAHLLQRIFCV